MAKNNVSPSKDGLLAWCVCVCPRAKHLDQVVCGHLLRELCHDQIGNGLGGVVVGQGRGTKIWDCAPGSESESRYVESCA